MNSDINSKPLRTHQLEGLVKDLFKDLSELSVTVGANCTRRQGRVSNVDF